MARHSCWLVDDQNHVLAGPVLASGTAVLRVVGDIFRAALARGLVRVAVPMPLRQPHASRPKGAGHRNGWLMPVHDVADHIPRSQDRRRLSRGVVDLYQPGPDSLLPQVLAGPVEEAELSHTNVEEGRAGPRRLALSLELTAARWGASETGSVPVGGGTAAKPRLLRVLRREQRHAQKKNSTRGGGASTVQSLQL